MKVESGEGSSGGGGGVGDLSLPAGLLSRGVQTTASLLLIRMLSQVINQPGFYWTGSRLSLIICDEWCEILQLGDMKL